MYPNLTIEMAVSNTTNQALAKCIGCTTKTFSEKLSGKSEFKCSEMRAIKAFFGKSMDYLFSDTRAEVSAS